MSNRNAWPWPHLWPFATETSPEVVEFDGGHWAIGVPAAGPESFVAPNRDDGLVILGVDGHRDLPTATAAIKQLQRAVSEAVHRIEFDGDEREQYLEAWRRRYMADTATDTWNARANLVHGWGMCDWSLERLVAFSEQHGVAPVPVVAHIAGGGRS